MNVSPPVLISEREREGERREGEGEDMVKREGGRGSYINTY